MKAMEIEAGLLLVNKPLGWTSFDVVNKIRYLSGVKKVGHAGTLDPAAEGLLIVAVGKECTRQLKDFVGLDKEYIAEVTLGIQTDSADRDGVIISAEPVKVSDEQIDNAVKKLVGEHDQLPPMFSAKKQKGKRLYELAREGIQVEREPVRIIIKEAELLSIEQGEYPRIMLRVLVTKGTYVRVIAEQLGELLQTKGFLSALKRTKIGSFLLADAQDIV